MRDTARRPLTARSVIASTLLGVDTPRLPASALVRSGELFGLREGATRTALSRMTAAGEVVADDAHYALTGHLLERHARQQMARTPVVKTSSWDGTWIATVVAGERRSARERSLFRNSAARLKLSEVREGVWMRPDNRPTGATRADLAVVDSQATWLREIVPDDPSILVRSFDLDGWAREARTLMDEMNQWLPAIQAGRVDALGEAFVIDADVVRQLVADPELPADLLPRDWPGPALREGFARFDEAFKSTWSAWHRSFQTP